MLVLYGLTHQQFQEHLFFISTWIKNHFLQTMLEYGFCKKLIRKDEPLTGPILIRLRSGIQMLRDSRQKFCIKFAIGVRTYP